MNVPQVWIDIDRERARRQDVPLPDLFATLGVYLGSAYVNDFNRFGRTYQVMAQADAPFRSQVEDIGNLRVRNTAGEMVPLGALVRIRETFGPDRVAALTTRSPRPISTAAWPRESARARRSRSWSGWRGRRCRRGWASSGPSSPTSRCRKAPPLLLVFPLCDPAGLPGAGGAVRELVAAAGRDPDRADVLCSGGHGRGAGSPRATTTSSPRSASSCWSALACKNAILIVEFARELRAAGPQHPAARRWRPAGCGSGRS